MPEQSQNLAQDKEQTELKTPKRAPNNPQVTVLPLVDDTKSSWASTPTQPHLENLKFL